MNDIATTPSDPDDDILPDWMFDDEDLQDVPSDEVERDLGRYGDALAPSR